MTELELTKKYIIYNNQEFLGWYTDQLKKNYYPYLNLDEIQGLINKIVAWYELKYPTTTPESFLNERTIDQLKLRLTPKEIEALDCFYRGSSYVCSINDEEKYYISIVLPVISTEYSIERITIYATKFGKITPHNINCFDSNLISINNTITLEEFLKQVKKSTLELDYMELERCIETHKRDLELRNRILSLAALSLLDSNNNIASKESLFRARKLLEEFNDYYNLNLIIREVKQNIDFNEVETSLIEKANSLMKESKKKRLTKNKKGAKHGR